MSGLLPALRTRFLRFRREILVLVYALVESGTPIRLRLAGLAVLLYLLSPFDLLPELLPVVGILDDVAIVPWAVSLLVGRIPTPQREEAEARADRFIRRWVTRPLAFAAAFALGLFTLWALCAWLIWLWLT